MQKTKINEMAYQPITVPIDKLADMLGCGHKTAYEIGTAAKARVQFGTRRVLWNVKKVQEYLDSISAE